MQISRYVNNEKYSQSNSSGFVKKLKTFALLFSPISIGCTASQQTQRIWPKGKIVFLQTRLFFFNKRQLLTNSWLLSRSYVRENNDSSKGLGFPFQLSLSFDFCLDEKPLKIPRKKLIETWIMRTDFWIVIHCATISSARAVLPSLQGTLRSVRTQSKRGLLSRKFMK